MDAAASPALSASAAASLSAPPLKAGSPAQTPAQRAAYRRAVEELAREEAAAVQAQDAATAQLAQTHTLQAGQLESYHDAVRSDVSKRRWDEKHERWEQTAALGRDKQKLNNEEERQERQQRRAEAAARATRDRANGLAREAVSATGRELTAWLGAPAALQPPDSL